MKQILGVYTDRTSTVMANSKQKPSRLSNNQNVRRHRMRLRQKERPFIEEKDGIYLHLHRMFQDVIKEVLFNLLLFRNVKAREL